MNKISKQPLIAKVRILSSPADLDDMVGFADLDDMVGFADLDDMVGFANIRIRNRC
jgi:hypothetical protein